MDYPSIAEVMGLGISSDDYPKYAFLGLLVDSWEIGYSLETMSAKAVQVQARTMFNSDDAPTWWAVAQGMERPGHNESRKGILCIG